MSGIHWDLNRPGTHLASRFGVKVVGPRNRVQGVDLIGKSTGAGHGFSRHLQFEKCRGCIELTGFTDRGMSKMMKERCIQASNYQHPPLQGLAAEAVKHH